MAGLLDSIGDQNSNSIYPAILNFLQQANNSIVPDFARVQPGQSLATGMVQAIPMAMNLLPAGRMGPLTGIRAYHGSPYAFDRFDMSKIGTGEGAQAYGHGLYFAENEGVAQAYKKNLAPAAADIAPSWKGGGWQVTTRDGGNFGREFFPTKEEAEAFAAKFNQGHMYEVNINAAPQQFLDWEKPFDQQSPQVQKAVGNILGGSVKPQMSDAARGYDIYNQIVNRGVDTRPSIFRDDSLLWREGPKNKMIASSMLNEAGIPGIRYLDQGSRGTGQGTSNYVVFNDKLIDILRRYGIVGMLGGGTAGLMPDTERAQ